MLTSCGHLDPDLDLSSLQKLTSFYAAETDTLRSFVLPPQIQTFWVTTTAAEAIDLRAYTKLSKVGIGGRQLHSVFLPPSVRELDACGCFVMDTFDLRPFASLEEFSCEGSGIREILVTPAQQERIDRRRLKVFSHPDQVKLVVEPA